jgi:molybdopterin-guanine dinucleotide biosynthesis protein A
MQNITGILLCGGKSQRMGADKATLVVENRYMALYPLEVLQAWCSEILISSNNERHDFSNYPIIPDEIKEIGPMGGLYSCLKRSAHHLNLLVACDMPMISGSLLRRMLNVSSSFDAIVPVWKNKPQPSYALYQKRIAADIEKAIERKNYSLQKLLAVINVYYVNVEHKEETELLNVNTPEELVQYEQWAKRILK